MNKEGINKRILFVTGEGIGNVIQTIPTIRTLKETLGYSVDMWHVFGSFPIRENIIPYIDNWYFGEEIHNIRINNYYGMTPTFWVRKHVEPLFRAGMPILCGISPLSVDRAEVDTYMDIARELGAKEEEVLWWGECNYISKKGPVDVVVHDGYNPYGSANWSIKSYPYYTTLVKLLQEEGLVVGSVGKRSEYIEKTVNMTGLSLLETFGCIKNASFFVGNDSGLYHAANALGVSNVVIFTATSVNKNYFRPFHKYSTLVFKDLECRPCQAQRRWAKDCKDWKCRNIEPDYIRDIIMREVD